MLDQIVPEEHVVQLYGDDSQLLITNVSRYLADALRRGEGTLVIATAKHRAAIYKQLWIDGCSPVQAEQDRQLVLADAGRTMAQFMVGGEPDWDRFTQTIQGILGTVHPRQEGAGGRAFGEMVALLWKAERYDQAICLEHYWNRLLKSSGYSLFCGYPVDVFSPDFHSDHMNAVLRAHSHLLPADRHLELVLCRAMDEVMGPRALEIREGLTELRGEQARFFPPGEFLVRWIRSHLSEYATEILRRARGYYSQIRTPTGAH
jgi:hypothetical protein